MKSLFKIALRYGAIGGAIGSIALLVLFYMGRHPFLLPVIFDFRIILFAVFIFFALKEFRDYYQEGILYFWQGMVGSYVLIITSGGIGAFVTWIFASWNDRFISSYVQTLMEQFTKNAAELVERVGKEAYEQQLLRLPQTTAGDLAADYFLKSIIIGLFLTIILSVILRRQPKTQ